MGVSTMPKRFRLQRSPERGRTVQMAEAGPARRGDLASAIAPRSNDPDIITYLGMLPNPDRILRKLGRTEEVYEDVLTDAHVASVVQSRKGAVLSREWGVRAASTRRADKKAAELCQAVLDALPLRDVLTALLDAPLRGRAYVEPMWEVVDGLLIPAKLLERPQRRFVYGEDEELRVRTRTSPVVGDAVPARKILQVRNHPTYDNPYGDAALSRCFWPYAFKKAGFKWWTAFAEKYGMPWVVGTSPRGASEEEKRTLDDALARAVVDAVLRVGEGTKIELVQAAGTTSSQVYREFTEANNAEISKAIVGQTLTTEVGDRGSYAAARVHGEVRDDIAQTDEALVSEGMCELSGWIAELNIPGATAPEFYFYAEETPATEWVDFIDKARKAYIGVPHAWALQRCGIPERSGDEAVLPAGETAPTGTEPDGDEGKVEFAESEEVVFDPVENREAIEWMRDRIVLTPDEWKRLTEEMQPRAFTVGRVDDVGALRELHGSMVVALEEGATVRDWVKEANAKLADRNLEALPQFLGETIFRTNALMALGAGRFVQMQRVADTRPFWMYDAVDDDGTRPTHRAMDGKVFRADDPIWDTWYPSNGFNCRCNVRTLSQRELERRGLRVEKGSDVAGEMLEVGGQVVHLVPDGGFATNPAKAPPAATVVRSFGAKVGPGLREHVRLAMASGETGGASWKQLQAIARGTESFQARWGTGKQETDDAEKLGAFLERDAEDVVEPLREVGEEVLERPDEVATFLFHGRRQFGFVRDRVEMGDGEHLRGVGVIYDPDEDRIQGIHVGYHRPGSRVNWVDARRIDDVE